MADLHDTKHWFVGAVIDGNDQTQRFIQQGIWEMDYSDDDAQTVNSIHPGDKIAIKSTYNRKKNLPFDNRGLFVSVMAIKAIGTVVSNPQNGYKLVVAWQEVNPPREWYFFTYPRTIWDVDESKRKENVEKLLRFTFEGEEQDIDWFMNRPYWAGRFGDNPKFPWIPFYEEMADKLLQFKDDRTELVEELHRISERLLSEHDFELKIANDKFPDGSQGPLQDICPFTVMGIFNRGITDEKRIVIAKELAEFLQIKKPAFETFEAIPIVNNQSSWFFQYARGREEEDIDKLWDIFAKALELADQGTEVNSDSFISAYDDALTVWGTKWNLTMGLYWIRPQDYATLDTQSRKYLEKYHFTFKGNPPTGAEYLQLISQLKEKFEESTFPVHSFPELSLASYKDDQQKENEADKPEIITEKPQEKPEQKTETYDVQSIVDEGCFIEKEELEKYLERLEQKKNIILQGPPGTSKTWLSKRLAYAAMGAKDNNKIYAVQFHPNLSYEDFIRGYRPDGKGGLKLCDGALLEMVEKAKKDPTQKYFLIVEEINRGNPSQVFGEMLTLLEADKRSNEHALALSYPRSEDERVYIPPNLYVIGTMNIADRSLATVDFALRRRFAFIDLVPQLNGKWLDWGKKCGLERSFLKKVRDKINALNDVITEDPTLGSAFCIGHSYVTPSKGQKIEDGEEWYRQIVNTELIPLLEEYWFDNPDEVEKYGKNLQL